MGCPLESGNVARMLIWLALDAHAEGDQAMMWKAWYSNRVEMLRFHASGNHSGRPCVNQRRWLHHVAELLIFAEMVSVALPPVQVADESPPFR